MRIFIDVFELSSWCGTAFIMILIMVGLVYVARRWRVVERTEQQRPAGGQEPRRIVEHRHVYEVRPLVLRKHPERDDVAGWLAEDRRALLRERHDD